MPPNFLLVDYYNIGSYNGSVFEVAANMNNVTYGGGCCGGQQSAAPVLSVSAYPYPYLALMGGLLPLLLY